MRLGISGFIRDIANMFRSGTVLGVDFGTASIKIAEVSRKGEQFRLENYGIIEVHDYLGHANLALQASSLDIIDHEASRLLKYLISEMKPKSTTAVVSIPSFASFITLLDIPLISEKETAQTVQFQAQKYIPMPINQVQVDWVKVDEYADERGIRFQRLLLIGIPEKVIVSYKNICKASGLRAVAFEIDGIALARSLAHLTQPTLVVDIGANSSTMIVVDNGVAKHLSQTDYGGVHITRALSKSLDLGMKRAETLKKRRGLLGKGGETELLSLILPFLDVIIQEVAYARSLYERRYGKKVLQFTFVGGGAELLGIEEHAAEQLGIPYVSPDTFTDVAYKPAIEPIIRNLAQELPVVVGLTKRYFLS